MTIFNRPLFATPMFLDADDAAYRYEKERKCLIFKGICTLPAMATTVLMCFNEAIAPQITARSLADVLLAVITLLGFAATLISSFRVVCGVFAFLMRLGKRLIPFYGIDLLGAVIGFVVAATAFGFFPVGFCVVSVVRSVLVLRAAKAHMGTREE